MSSSAGSEKGRNNPEGTRSQRSNVPPTPMSTNTQLGDHGGSQTDSEGDWSGHRAVVARTKSRLSGQPELEMLSAALQAHDSLTTNRISTDVDGGKFLLSGQDRFFWKDCQKFYCFWASMSAMFGMMLGVLENETRFAIESHDHESKGLSQALKGDFRFTLHPSHVSPATLFLRCFPPPSISCHIQMVYADFKKKCIEREKEDDAACLCACSRVGCDLNLHPFRPYKCWNHRRNSPCNDCDYFYVVQVLRMSHYDQAPQW